MEGARAGGKGLCSWGRGVGEGLAGASLAACDGAMRWFSSARWCVCVCMRVLTSARAPVCVPVCATPAAPPSHISPWLPGELFLQNTKMTVWLTHARNPHTAPFPRCPLPRSSSAFTHCPQRCLRPPRFSLAAAPGTPGSPPPSLLLLLSSPRPLPLVLSRRHFFLSCPLI